MLHLHGNLEEFCPWLQYESRAIFSLEVYQALCGNSKDGSSAHVAEPLGINTGTVVGRSDAYKMLNLSI
jgi:hypothetical protein